jgi:hypothetical protein
MTAPFEQLHGKSVCIDWHGEDHDWHNFKVLDSAYVGFEEVWLKLKGLGQNGAKHTGGPFWIRLSDVDVIEEKA